MKLARNENFSFTLLAGLIAWNISSETKVDGREENRASFTTFPRDIRIHRAITRTLLVILAESDSP